jgi:CRISPR-associated protein Cas6
MNEIAAMVDVAFTLEADDPSSWPRDYRHALAEALETALPWLASVAGAGVHRLNVSAGGGPDALLSRRTRLTLRVPRSRLCEVTALAGAELAVGEQRLRLGEAHVRELLPWGTLYAHFVAAADADESNFLASVEQELDQLGVPCRAICGRRQELEAGALQGFSLMLDGLSRESALRVLEHGIGAHRRLGCGLFVPHKSAAAVGSSA